MTPTPERSRPTLLVASLLLGYALGVGWLAFSTLSDVNSVVVPLLAQVEDALPWITYSRAEYVTNVLVFIPIGFLASILPGCTPIRVLLITIIAATAIEAIQFLLLPGRTASGIDVVNNVAGAAIGILAAEPISRKFSSPTRIRPSN